MQEIIKFTESRGSLLLRDDITSSIESIRDRKIKDSMVRLLFGLRMLVSNSIMKTSIHVINENFYDRDQTWCCIRDALREGVVSLCDSYSAVYAGLQSISASNLFIRNQFIPREIFAIICQYVSYRDFMKLRRVNKAWRNYVSAQPRFQDLVQTRMTRTIRSLTECFIMRLLNYHSLFKRLTIWKDIDFIHMGIIVFLQRVLLPYQALIKEDPILSEAFPWLCRVVITNGDKIVNFKCMISLLKKGR